MTQPTPNATREAVELLPCPFCGGEEVGLHHSQANQMSWVSCRSCGLEAPCETGVTDEQAIAYWNTRSPSEERRKAMEEAASLCDDRAAGRQAMYDENGASINAHKAVEAEEIASAIRTLADDGRAG